MNPHVLVTSFNNYQHLTNTVSSVHMWACPQTHSPPRPQIISKQISGSLLFYINILVYFSKLRFFSIITYLVLIHVSVIVQKCFISACSTNSESKWGPHICIRLCVSLGCLFLYYLSNYIRMNRKPFQPTFFALTDLFCM